VEAAILRAIDAARGAGGIEDVFSSAKAGERLARARCRA
jgi:hypothetical protein